MALQVSYLLSLLLLILLLPYSTTAQTSSNQSLGSSLTAQEKDSYWASPSGDFAFGFSQFGKGGYLLAIWFNKLPEKTVVWSANGDNLVPGGSKVELTKDGKFVLNDPAGLEIWKFNLVSSGVAYAAMLDTGNFSFDHPTDTMLPSQTMSQGSKLVARYSEMNYSNGRFLFQLQLNGSLVLHTRAYPTDYSYADYWPEEPIGSGFKVVFNQSGSIIFTTANGSIDFYQRAIMEYDGVLRHYVYPKSSLMSRSRSSLPTFIPSSICNFVPLNIYCMLDDQRPKCQCPDGYTFIDPEDVMKGCKQNFLSQSCDEALPESDLFYLKSMPNTEWPGLSDYEFFLGQDEEKVPLSNGRMDSSFEGKALIKIRKDNSTLKPLVLLSSSVFLNLLFLLAVFLLVFHFKSWKPKALKPYPVMPGMNLRSYTNEELTEATNGFREELGRGAFAKLYKGVLEYEGRKLVAVKRMNDMVKEGDLEFKAEVSAIGRTNHRNLVQLLGFCNKGQHRLLVYEFMSNGSLASFLFGVLQPYWHQRIQIALEAARGLFHS
ncbi:hypothetical protein RGQ29_001871 [Quercus rubra]|uniref:non-specific serine/threonine protein kinase n=1 Tax=Quercus rubra TaxID=3512 RepID=A0AAN7GE98_QUERU|nr:hypothetical protein RGQ29_001871 [Quercus rubra]